MSPDFWRGALCIASRFAGSVPGQILVNTATFTLPEELRMQPAWRVLDVACGRASVLRVIADRAGLERPPLGVDMSRAALSQARRDMAGEGGPPVELGQAASEALPFAGSRFDLLIAGHAFRRLPDDELRTCLLEGLRVLKPGGLFLAWEFAPTRSQALDRWNRWLLEREAPNARLRSYRELRDIAYDCGFDWVEQAHLRPFLLPPIPRVSLIMGRAPAGWQRAMVDGRPVLQHQGEGEAASP
ncbi:MAG: class I SAM-dependent methyltransferase [Dehalococcoidia bacterium]